MRLDALRRRFGLVLLLVILAAGTASLVSLLQDEQYSASASLTERRAADVEPAPSNTVARRTAELLSQQEDPAAARVVSSVEVTRRDGSIAVEATALSPRVAARVANAFADEYAAYLNASRGGSQASVVERAAPPASPSSPKPVRNTLLGALAGLLLGIVLALAIGRSDRLRDPKDLEDAFGLPVLTKLPESKALGTRSGVAGALPSAEADAFRQLRARLRHSGSGADADSVLITSAAVEDGKSTVAFNLAAAAAAAGLRVLLVEADVCRPILAHSLGLPPNEQGLTALLAGDRSRLADVSYEVLLRHADRGGARATMDVVLAGEIVRDAGDLIESERMRHVIREARRSYALVVIDTAPAGLVSDPAPLMGEVSAVVVVGRVGELTGDEADRLRDLLERIEAPAVGVVANFAARA